jgi:DNA-binding MarR family transcriptional regulator
MNVSHESAPHLDEGELRILIQKLARRIRSQRADDSLSDSHLAVLFHLERDGARAPIELARLERISAPSMNRALNSLEALGLVARTRSATDARKVDVTLTAEGRATIEATRRLRTEWFAERLAELSETERAALTAAAPVLRHLIDS